MSYISGFSDNQLIGVDDLNAITKRLVTSGVGDILSSAGSIDVTELNGMTAAIATDGVVPEKVTSLKVTYSDGKAKIAPGVAFFADGSFIEITEEEAISLSGGGYVYLINDTALGVREPRATSSLPTGDYVMLASVAAGGAVTDMRKSAKGKVAGYSSYAGYPVYVSQDVVCTGTNKFQRVGTFNVDVTGMPLNGIVIKGSSDVLTDATGVCIFDEDRNTCFYRCMINKEDSSYITEYLYMYYKAADTYARVYFSCSNDILTVTVVSSNSGDSAGTTATEHIEFIIF